MTTVRAAPPDHLPWIIERAGMFLSPSARAVEAVDERGRILGMVAFDGWTENSAQAHIAVDSPQVWTRLLRPAFRYAFVQAGKGLLVAMVSAGNPRSARFTAGIGFRETHRIKDGVSVGVDFIIFEMRREECRWLR